MMIKNGIAGERCQEGTCEDRACRLYHGRPICPRCYLALTAGAVGPTDREVRR